MLLFSISSIVGPSLSRSQQEWVQHIKVWRESLAKYEPDWKEAGPGKPGEKVVEKPKHTPVVLTDDKASTVDASPADKAKVAAVTEAKPAKPKPKPIVYDLIKADGDDDDGLGGKKDGGARPDVEIVADLRNNMKNKKRAPPPRRRPRSRSSSRSRSRSRSRSWSRSRSRGHSPRRHSRRRRRSSSSDSRSPRRDSDRRRTITPPPSMPVHDRLVLFYEASSANMEFPRNSQPRLNFDPVLFKEALVRPKSK